MATPDGGLVKLEYSARVHSYLDEGRRNHPDFSGVASYYPNLTAYEEGNPVAISPVAINTDSVFRTARWDTH